MLAGGRVDEGDGAGRAEVMREWVEREKSVKDGSRRSG